jgi:diguanylate cyclase (GGDEF)-like protein/PAS domain S-box-containing protein
VSHAPEASFTLGILDGLPEGAVVHRQGRIVYINQHGVRLLGAGSPAQLHDAPFLDRVHPDYVEVVRERVRASEGERRGSALREEVLLRMDGSPFYAEVISLPIRFAGQDATLTLFSDISERRRHEEEMRLASSVYENSGEAILVTDRDNRIVAVNPAFTRLTGYAIAEVRGHDPKMLASGRHDRAFYRDMWKTILETGQWQGEIWNRRKGGEELAEWVTINTIRDAHGGVDRRVCIFSDITERKQAEERVWRQAYYDSLTTLPNRRLFQDRLQHEIRTSLRDATPVALMMIDLDRFKEVNDTLGHEVGDQLLMEAARRISHCVRESDTVARLGGDEFAVILPRMHEQSRLAHAAQSVIDVLARPFALAGQSVGVSGSIGISTFPADAGDCGSLMKNADQAMYQAKGAGRNRVAYFTPSMQRHADERISLTSDLRNALAQGELRVEYQPIVEPASGRIVKAEALLRWTHPVRGPVAPAQFIPLAEESGLILEIGEWVFAQALEAVAHWRSRFGRTIPVGVNKSALQFSDESGARLRLERLDAMELPGEAIAFEITEGTLLRDSPTVKQNLVAIRACGIAVAIDDFGTGTCSLPRLRDFALDYLKIDRSFIAGLPGDAGHRTLTEAMIAMAHKLGMRVIAEGVETAGQRDMLVAFGCDLAQGFLWSPSVPLEAFDDLLAKEGGGR